MDLFTNDTAGSTTQPFPQPMATNVTAVASESDVLAALETLVLTDTQRVEANNVLMLVRYVFLVVSLPVTVCNVFVFLQKRMRSATSVYILGLSFAQIFFLCSHIGLILWSQLHSAPRSSLYFCLYQVYAVSFGSVIARRGSYVILCFVSVERLYAVLRPLHVKSFVLSKFSLAVMLATFLVTTLWHIFVPVKFVVTMVEVEAEAGTSLECRSKVTSLYLRHQDVSDTFDLAVKILMTYVALILQIILNVLTVWALRRHNHATAKQMASSASEEARRQRERQLTVTILVTTLAYVVLSLPACLNGLLNIVVPDYKTGGRYGNLASVVYNVCLDLQILSCSVDFVCFFALSSNYRRTFFHVFPCLKTPAMRGKESESDSERTLQASVDSSE